MKHGGGHIAPFPKGLRLCIIGSVLRVIVEIQAGFAGFLEVKRFEFFFHDSTTHVI